MKKALVTTNKQELNAAAFGKSLTQQYHKAVGGMREICVFGAMMIRLRELLKSTCGLGKSVPRGMHSDDGGVQAWLARNAPEIKKATAYRFLHVTESVMAQFDAPKKIGFVDLALTPPKDLPNDKARAKQEELWDFVNGTSQRSWLDRFAPKRPFGGVYYPRRPKEEGPFAPTGDPEKDYYLSLSPAEQCAYDLWAPTIGTLYREGTERRSWMHLPQRELDLLRGLVLDLNRLMRNAEVHERKPAAPAPEAPEDDDIFARPPEAEADADSDGITVETDED